MYQFPARSKQPLNRREDIYVFFRKLKISYLVKNYFKMVIQLYFTKYFEVNTVKIELKDTIYELQQHPVDMGNRFVLFVILFLKLPFTSIYLSLIMCETFTRNDVRFHNAIYLHLTSISLLVKQSRVMGEVTSSSLSDSVLTQD